MTESYQVDFAISYAGEDSAIAEELDQQLRELGFEVFFAKRNFSLLVGTRMDDFFAKLFSRAKQVIVLISEHYNRKEWTQFEWDVINQRDWANRFIPVRLDECRILGLPRTMGYLQYRESVDEIVDVASQRLLEFERSHGIARPTEYDRILEAIKHQSKGAIAQAYQLLKDKRKRTPLDNVDVPACEKPVYKVDQEEWFNFSVVRRLSIKVLLPPGLSRDLILANLKHCGADFFNAYKPDALVVYGYFEGESTDRPFTAGRVIFAPFGKWDKAQDGVAYNIPVEEFEYAVDLEPDAFAKLFDAISGETAP